MLVWDSSFNWSVLNEVPSSVLSLKYPIVEVPVKCSGAL